MKVITLNGIIKQIPSCWTELKQNKEAFIYVIGLMLAQKFTRQEILQLAAFKVLKVSKQKQLLIIKDIENNENSNHPENLYRLSEIMKFITDETLDVSENLFPKIQNLYAPSSILGDFTAYQYALCEKTFFDFVETNNINDLDKLISLIYNRKKFFTGDFLMFDEKKIIKISKANFKNRLFNKVVRVPMVRPSERADNRNTQIYFSERKFKQSRKSRRWRNLD